MLRTYIPKMKPVQVPLCCYAHVSRICTPPQRKVISTSNTLHLPIHRLISTVNDLRDKPNQPDNQVANNGLRELREKAQDAEVVPQKVKRNYL
ncbi:hypothetical protein Pst134EB_023352 [Puccinia striiformis f. sp. tritici]|nr:hypothetical protein Pst134EB_023352 [Puccinia striiformis f. sp. tritici]